MLTTPQLIVCTHYHLPSRTPTTCSLPLSLMMRNPSAFWFTVKPNMTVYIATNIDKVHIFIDKATSVKLLWIQITDQLEKKL